MEDINVSINAGIDIFKSNIANAINESHLPVGIIYYVLKDVLLELQDLYNDTLQKEMEELNKQLKENENKNDEKIHQKK